MKVELLDIRFVKTLSQSHTNKNKPKVIINLANEYPKAANIGSSNI